MNDERLRATGATLVEPGEQLQSVVPAWKINPALGTVPLLRRLFGFVWLVRRANVAVIFTDKRILLCHRGQVRLNTVTTLWSAFPRDTKIEFGQGEYMKSKSLGRRLFFRENDTGELLRAENWRRKMGSAPPEPAARHDDETRASWYQDPAGSTGPA